MKHLYKMVSIILVVSMCFSTFAFAVDEGTTITSSGLPQNAQEITLDECIERLNIDVTDAINVEWKTVELGFSNTDSICSYSTNDPELEVPSIVVVNQNEDGSFTTSAYVELAVQDDGTLSSTISRATNGTYYNAFANSGFVFRFDATYDEVNMSTYGYSGYAYAPRYSKYKITSSGAYGYPTAVKFYMLLHGQFSASSANPASRDDDWPEYERSSYIGTPTLGQQYSYYDYTAYASDYSGRLVHISNGGEGSYFLKCEFTYNGVEHSIKGVIYNGSDENF